jgi:hypothetical protein
MVRPEDLRTWIRIPGFVDKGLSGTDVLLIPILREEKK